MNDFVICDAVEVVDATDLRIAASCEAWNKLIALPETAIAVWMRKWADRGEC